MGRLPRFIIFLPFQILTIPIDAEPGDLPHIQSAGGARSPYGLPTRRDDNNDELDQIWIWSAGIQVNYLGKKRRRVGSGHHDERNDYDSGFRRSKVQESRKIL